MHDVSMTEHREPSETLDKYSKTMVTDQILEKPKEENLSMKATKTPQKPAPRKITRK